MLLSHLLGEGRRELLALWGVGGGDAGGQNGVCGKGVGVGVHPEGGVELALCWLAFLAPGKVALQVGRGRGQGCTPALLLWLLCLK